MADTIQSRYVRSPITLRQLINSSYNSKFRDRWREPMEIGRHLIRLESVTVWKIHYRQDTPEREKVHTYRVRVYNIKPEGTTNYQTTILMDQLQLDAPVKIRCGKQYKYTNGMSRDQIKRKGLCMDFRMRFEWLHSRNGSLYGRDATNGQPPKITNPGMVPGICKHLISSCRILLSSGYFQRVDPQRDIKEARDFINQFGY